MGMAAVHLSAPVEVCPLKVETEFIRFSRRSSSGKEASTLCIAHEWPRHTRTGEYVSCGVPFTRPWIWPHGTKRRSTPTPVHQSSTHTSRPTSIQPSGETRSACLAPTSSAQLENTAAHSHLPVILLLLLLLLLLPHAATLVVELGMKRQATAVTEAHGSDQEEASHADKHRDNDRICRVDVEDQANCWRVWRSVRCGHGLQNGGRGGGQRRTRWCEPLTNCAASTPPEPAA